MSAITTTSFRAYAGKKAIDGLLDTDTNLYIFVGKPTPWADDTQPPVPQKRVSTIFDVWRDVVALKKISASDTSLVIPRNNWKSGVVYTEYRHDIDMFDLTAGRTPFFIITNPELNVYKCISNNGGIPSIVKPSGTSTNIIATADGYLWKFMYTVDPTLVLKFLTNEWMPVKTLLTDDGTRQWDVQQTVIPGTIEKIAIDDPGSGFTSAPTITITGDGVNADAIAEVSGGEITGITIRNRGSGYTTATASVSGGGGSGAILTPIISPPGGHGSDPVAELGAKHALFNVRLLQNESGKLTTNNDFRKVGLIFNPRLRGTTSLATATVYRQSTILHFVSTTGSWLVDELVSGGSSGATGRVLDYDAGTKSLQLVEVVGTFQPGENISNSGGSGVSGTLELVNGTAQGGGTNTITLAASDTAASDFYVGYSIRITGGTGSGQQRVITGNNFGTKQATVDENWSTQPDGTSTYSIVLIEFPELETASGRVLSVEHRRPIERASDQLEDIKIITAF